MIQVIDNVVSLKYQDGIESTFYSKDFLWKYNPNLTGDKINRQFGLAHQIIENYNSTSNFADYMIPLVYEISEKSGIDFHKIYNGRSFLQMPMGGQKTYDIFHTDVVFPHIVFLYYVNDSDGDTIILDKLYNEGDPFFLDKDYDFSNDIVEKVSPKKGRVVVFNGFQYHAAGIPQKDPRCVLNFNVT